MADPITPTPTPVAPPPGVNIVIPPKVAAYIWIIYTILTVSVLPALGMYSTSKAFAIATAIATSLGAVLRLLTTNSFAQPPKDGGFSTLRTAAFLFLFSVGALGCHSFIDCAKVKVGDDVLVSLISAANNPANWEADLVALLGTAGKDAVGCAVDAELKQLEGPPPVGGDGTMPAIFSDRDRALARLYYAKVAYDLKCVNGVAAAAPKPLSTKILPQ